MTSRLRLDSGRSKVIGVMAIACGLVACSDSGDSWSPLSASQAASIGAKREKAEEARDALAGQLLQELQAALTEGGPERGIEVCSVRAGEIAAATATEHGVSIGRTSFLLRNPRNTAPPWAAASVAARTAEPQFFQSTAGTVGALYPIKLQSQCLLCHGPKEQLAPDVQAALAARYPTDAATGFLPGDLRGWFWVEVP